MTISAGSKTTSALLNKTATINDAIIGQYLRVPDRSLHRDSRLMPPVSMISPYKPITCGIADYTEFLTQEAPMIRWDILSFNLDNYGVALTKEQPSTSNRVWYGIPSRDDFSAASILRGLRRRENHVLWFQHEFGIWRDNIRFMNMLRHLKMPKVVSLHTLHFQSNQTKYGLRKEEYSFLQSILPHVNAITAFSDGVYTAVTQAFPDYTDKVHVLRHGAHQYPKYSRTAKLEVKARIHDYLVNESGLDAKSRVNLKNQRAFLDPDTIVIGGTGFITASKGTELLYRVCEKLRRMLPERKIAAVYVGRLREHNSGPDARVAVDLKAKHNGPGEFFLETYLPQEMLAAMLRALDIYFYWPGDCTQSGIIAHALGAGTAIACRDMEGVGETVRMAGGLTSADLEELVLHMRQAIVDPGLRMDIEEKTLRYAAEFSWKNQLLRHLELAEELCSSCDLIPANLQSINAKPLNITPLSTAGSAV